MPDHFIYSKESAFRTWVTPARWLPVTNANIQSAREMINLRASGAGRGQYLTVLGAKPVNGPVECPWWTVNIGSLINTFMRDLVTTTPTTGVYDHALLFDDDADFLGISAQQQRGPSTGVVATNVLSAVVKSFKIALAAKAEAKLTFDFEAVDEAPAGGLWDYNGGASPAVITPTAYPTLRRPLMFYDTTVIMGGTPSISGNKLSIAGGTTYNLFKSFEVAVDLGLDTDGFALCADPTRQELPAGQRTINVTGERSWSDFLQTFYANWRAGTAMALDIAVVGPVISSTYHYEAHITLPSLFLTDAKYPAVDGAAAPKKQTLAAIAQTDTTTGVDMGIWIRTSEATL